MTRLTDKKESNSVENLPDRRRSGRPDRRKAPEKIKTSRTVETLFRNALKSNLELTSLADTKASILISVNGFILTVMITASGFQLNEPQMEYAFVSIILTALFSITFAVLAIRPRFKKHLLDKPYQDAYSSVLYFQDMADYTPDEYVENVRKVIASRTLTHEHIIKHLHMLGREIKLKYLWLKRAYTVFAAGLIISAVFVIASLLVWEQELSTNRDVAQQHPSRVYGR